MYPNESQSTTFAGIFNKDTLPTPLYTLERWHITTLIPSITHDVQIHVIIVDVRLYMGIGKVHPYTMPR